MVAIQGLGANVNLFADSGHQPMIQMISMGVIGILAAISLWLWWRIASARAGLWSDDCTSDSDRSSTGNVLHANPSPGKFPYQFSTHRCYLIPLGMMDLLVLMFLISTIQLILQPAVPKTADEVHANAAALAGSPAAPPSAAAEPNRQTPPDSRPEPTTVSVSDQWRNSFGKIAMVGLGLGWLSIRYRRATREWIRVSQHQWRRLLALSGQSWLMVLPPVLILHAVITQLIPYRHPTIDSLRTSADSGMLLASWIGAVVAAPLFEEFLFRGLLIHWLTHAILASWGNFERVVLGNWLVDEELYPNYSSQTPQWELRPETLGGWGSHPSLPKWGWPIVYWVPVLVSSALFGMAHWGQGMAAIPLTCLGLFLGVLFRQSRSLWPCVLVHMAFNAYTMFWLSLSIWEAGVR